MYVIMFVIPSVAKMCLFRK